MHSNKLYRHDMDIWRYEDHWGEIGSRKKQSLTSDVVKNIILGAEKPDSPKEYLFSVGKEESDEVQLPPDFYPPNEIIRHTIRLNFYSKKLQQYIRALAIRKTEYRGPSVSKVGKVPEMTLRRKERIYGFSSGQSHPLPSIDQNLARRMLEKAVLTILSQTGYDKVRRAALDTLVDVVAEFISKVCRLSHAFSQHDLNRGRVAYDDVLEKSLRTVGQEGIHSVKDYYKRRVLMRRDKAHARAKRLLTIYDKLLTKYGLSPSPSSDPGPSEPGPSDREPDSDVFLIPVKYGFKVPLSVDHPGEGSSSHE